MQRMGQGRLPRRILELCPPGRRRKGRPRNSWMQEVTTRMSELASWNGSTERAEKENKFTLDTERCENIKNLCIEKLLLLLL